MRQCRRAAPKAFGGHLSAMFLTIDFARKRLVDQGYRFFLIVLDRLLERSKLILTINLNERTHEKNDHLHDGGVACDRRRFNRRNTG
jgi:hypothetical protein